MSRRAGQYARETTRRLAVRGLVALTCVVSAGLLTGVIAGFRSGTFLLAELVAIAAVVAIDRFGYPIVDRWDRGASGEEHVGAILNALSDEGWIVVHDVDTGRGNIDHVAVGRAGIFTIET